MKAIMGMAWVLVLAAPVFAFRAGPQEVHKKNETALKAAALFQSGYSKVIAGEYAEAIKIFDELEANYADSEVVDDALFWKAFGTAESGQPAGAIKMYQALAEKYPKSNYADDALFKVAELYEMKLRDYDKAIEAYEQLIKKYPSSEWAASGNLREGQLQSRHANRYDDALWNLNEAQNRVAKVDPKTASSHWIWKAAEQEKQFLMDNKDHDWIPVIHFFAARELKEKKEYDRAIEKLRKLLADYPKARIADDADLEIAACMVAAAKAGDAVKHLSEFKTRNPESPLVKQAEAVQASTEKRLKDQMERQKNQPSAK